MKKILLIPFLFFTVSIFAQVRWGLEAGFLSTDISNMDLVTTKRSTNFSGGLMADIPLGKSDFHILSRVLYSPLGYGKSNIQAVDESGNNIGTIAFHRITYIQVPVYFLRTAHAGKIKVQGGLGPWFALKTGDKLRINNGGDTFGNETVLPGNADKINSILAGIGFQMGIESSGLTITAHLKQSFNKLYEMNAGNVGGWKVNGFGISLGYYIH